MKNLYKIFSLLVIIIYASSCSPTINKHIYRTIPPLSSIEPVVVFTPSEPIPSNARIIGRLEYDPSASMKCRTPQQIEELKELARENGANAFKIRSAAAIDNESCIKVAVDLLLLENTIEYQNKDKTLYANEDDVTLFLYRIKHIYKRRKSFTILLNNQEVGVLNHATKLKVSIPEGEHILSIKEIYGSEINFTAKEGTANYLRLYFHRASYPTLQITDPLVGRLEYESFDQANNEIFEYKLPEEVKNDTISQEQNMLSEVYRRDVQDRNTEEENFFKENPTAQNPTEATVQQQAQQFDLDQKNEPLGFRASASTGFGRRLGRTPSGLPSNLSSYLNDLKSGMSIDLSAAIFFDETNGIGFKFNRFFASADASFITFNFPGFNVSGPIDTNETMTLFALTYNNRYKSSSNKNELHISYGLGYFRYMDKSTVGNRSYELLHETLGISSDISYDINIGKNLFLGLQAGLFLGSADKAKFTPDTGNTSTIDLDDNAESFTRIDFSIGLRYIIN